MGKRKSQAVKTRQSVGQNPPVTAAADSAGAPTKPKPATDEYVSTRSNTEAPLRSDKLAHARRMIENGSYNDPKVIAEIIDRLMHALKS